MKRNKLQSKVGSVLNGGFVVLLLLVMVSGVQAAIYDFEAPTYSGSNDGSVALAGQDGWTANVANAVMNVASGHVIPAGDQAAYLNGDGYARHSLTAETFADGTEFSWLQRVYADWNTTDLNNGDGATYTEVTFEADGLVYVLSGGSGNVSTGVTWAAGLSGGDTFKVREVLDFTNQQYNVLLTNLTAGTPEVDTGWHNFWAATTAAGASGTSSEVLLRMRSGGTYDDVAISTVPEPATMMLMALGGMALLRRKS